MRSNGAKGIPGSEVEVFPFRLPSDETVARFLERVQGIRSVIRITMHGPQVYYGKKIEVAGKTIPLKIQVSKFWIGLGGTDEMEKLRGICNEIFPYGFSLKIGRFTRPPRARGLGGRPPIIRTDILKDEE